MKLSPLPLVFGALLASSHSAFAQLPLHQVIDSPDSSTAFGISSALLGDVDGDGVADYAIGKQTAIPFSPADKVQVFSGASGALLVEYVEENAGDDFGIAVSGAGDQNGDGVPDLLVGAPSNDLGGLYAGKAKVISGVDGTELLAFLGTADNQGLGRYAAAIGDLGTDGIPELLVSAPGENIPPSWGGIVRVYRGGDGVELMTLGNAATTHDIAEGFGDSLAAAGDLNGDGVADFLLGIPGRLQSPFGRTGAVEARSGVDGSVLFELLDTQNPVSNQAFGKSIAGGTDLNGDGVPELLIGASGDKQTGTMLGAIFVFDGATQVLLAKQLGHASGPGSLGHHVAFVGDVNGDGFEDYAGAHDSGGTAGYSGYVQVFSGADHSLLEEFAPGTMGFGSTLLALGDITGDLMPDLLVGARQSRQVQILAVAGSRAYGKDPAEATQGLDFEWLPTGGTDAARGRISVTGAPPGAPGFFVIAHAPGVGDFLGATLLVDLADPTLVLVGIPFDGSGSFQSPETTLRQPQFDGLNLNMQALALDPSSPIGFVSSAGLEVRLTD